MAQFNAGYSNPSSLDATSFRLDQVIYSKLTLFGRYNYSPSSLDLRGPAFSSGSVLSTIQSLSSTVHTGTIGLAESVSPRISNEFRANYSNDRGSNTYGLDSFGGAVPIPNSVAFPSGYSSANGLLLFAILGTGEYVLGKVGTNEQRQVNVVDGLSVTSGSHQMKFGVDYRWLAPFSSPSAYHQFAQFSGVTAATGGALSGTTLFAQSVAFQPNALLTHNL